MTMNYIPTNDDMNNLAESAVHLTNSLVAKTHPLLDMGSRASVSLAVLAIGTAQMAMAAMAMNEVVGDGIFIAPADLLTRVSDILKRDDYVARLRRLHDAIRRDIRAETGLQQVRCEDSHDSN